MSRSIIALMATILFVQGCAEANSIYRHKRIDNIGISTITAVDAKQRLIYTQRPEPKDPKEDPSFRRFCAEPSPDIFSVLSQAASGNGSFAGGADAKGANAALQGAFSNSETGATIPRTQTNNLLREMMFRTCERYLSGAISRVEFPIIAARDQRIIVSILAIEQLTGTVTPKTVAITNGGTASTGQSSGDTVKLLAASSSKVDTAKGEVKAAKEAFVAADKPAGSCDTLKKKKADGTPALTTDETTELVTCTATEAKVTAAADDLDSAKAHYENLVKASQSGAGASTAATSGALLAGSIGDSVDRSASIASVANSVETIVAATFNQDETQLLCIRMITDEKTSKDFGETARSQCLAYLMTRVATENAALAARYGLPPTAYQAAVDAIPPILNARANLTETLKICATDSTKLKSITSQLNADAGLKPYVAIFTGVVSKSSRDIALFLDDIGTENETNLRGYAQNSCK